MWSYAQSELENQTQVLPILSDISLILTDTFLFHDMPNSLHNKSILL